jgi:hypothetical protein
MDGRQLFWELLGVGFRGKNQARNNRSVFVYGSKTDQIGRTYLQWTLMRATNEETTTND